MEKAFCLLAIQSFNQSMLRFLLVARVDNVPIYKSKIVHMINACGDSVGQKARQINQMRLLSSIVLLILNLFRSCKLFERQRWNLQSQCSIDPARRRKGRTMMVLSFNAESADEIFTKVVKKVNCEESLKLLARDVSQFIKQRRSSKKRFSDRSESSSWTLHSSHGEIYFTHSLVNVWPEAQQLFAEKFLCVLLIT